MKNEKLFRARMAPRGCGCPSHSHCIYYNLQPSCTSQLSMQHCSTAVEASHQAGWPLDHCAAAEMRLCLCYISPAHSNSPKFVNKLRHFPHHVHNRNVVASRYNVNIGVCVVKVGAPVIAQYRIQQSTFHKVAIVKNNKISIHNTFEYCLTNTAASLTTILCRYFAATFAFIQYRICEVHEVSVS